MPGRKRLRQEINGYHAGLIERQADLLEIRLGDAQIGLSHTARMARRSESSVRICGLR